MRNLRITPSPSVRFMLYAGDGMPLPTWIAQRENLF